MPFITLTIKRIKDILFHANYNHQGKLTIDDMNCYYETKDGERIPIVGLVVVRDRYEEYVVFLPE